MDTSASSIVRRPQLLLYARERIRQLLSGGLTCTQIVEALQREGINTCRQTVWRLERHINTHGTIIPLRKSGRPTKLTDVALMKIDDVMSQDDETTAKELVVALGTIGVQFRRSLP